MSDTLRVLFSVFKLRIGFAIMLCTLAGIAIAPGVGPQSWQVAVLALAVLMSSASAGAFNQLVERDLDMRMRRTRQRPFVTGRFRAGWRWYAVTALLVIVAVAAAGWATNAVAAVNVLLGAVTYGIVYTLWLKRRSRLNIVIGGLAGSFAVLAGATAVDANLAPAPLILALVLFLWTPPHFWSLAFAYREDYARAGVPMLPVVVGERAAARAIFAHTVALVGLSLVPVVFGAGWIYLLGAGAGGAVFVRESWRLLRHPSTVLAMKNFHASLIQLGALLGATILDAWLIAGE